VDGVQERLQVGARAGDEHGDLQSVAHEGGTIAVTEITENAGNLHKTTCRRQRRRPDSSAGNPPVKPRFTGPPMLLASLITLVIVAALGYSQAERNGGLISHHSYNNRYNDASAAREDHL
jgi:hypothetical protein